MSLFDAAKHARDHAGQCADPACHAVALALEAALDAQAREQLAGLEPEPDESGTLSPVDSGYVSEIHIERPDYDT